MVAIDTLSYARRLEKAGVPREQAEARAEAVHDLVREEVATKADVQSVKRDLRETEIRLKREIREVEARLKADIREVGLRLSARMNHLESRLSIRLGGMLAAAVPLTAALVKLL